MSQPRPWLDEIIYSLIELGGHGTLKDIVNKIEERNIMDFKANPYWKSRIRESIYSYSSDCDAYSGRKDIFYAVEGKGKGHWGLRNFEPNKNNIDLVEDDMEFEEGKKKLVQHIYRERNQKVLQLAKKRFKKKKGRLYCQICKFDFEEKYGDIGKDYIEGHHIIPISEIPEGYKTKPDDIVLLCSNCHRMLHRKRPWLSIETLKKLIYKNR